MGTLSSPTKVKNIYQRLAFWTSATRQVAVDSGSGSADTPLFRPQMDISAFGITGNLAGTDQANFEAALAAAAGTTLVIDKPVSITANTTIGATNTLHFTRSGRLTVADGIKLTFTDGCSFNDCTHEIFDFVGAVKIAGIIDCDFWRPEWFGKAPNVAAANTMSFINDMYDSVRAGNGNFYPKVFRFRREMTYWTDDALEFISTNSIMNDLVLECLGGSRWGGAVLRSNTGGMVIDASPATSGGLITRCAFRGIQFRGKGSYGDLQTDYVVNASALDLLEVTNCGWFYCNYGIQMRDGGAGAAIFTMCYFVNSRGVGAYDTSMMDISLNARMTQCIIENSICTVNGNSTEPFTLHNCHIEQVSITVPEQTFWLGGAMGTTNSVVITLMPPTCNCYVTIREVGSYCIDLGHYNHIDAGYRYAECKGVPSSVVNMAFPASRHVGNYILQKDVPWLLSIGISRDGATDAGLTDYNFKLYDMSSTDTDGDVADATTFIDYGTIEVGGNISRFIPVWYQQQWECVVPENNTFVKPSHNCNFRATRPINRTPMFRYSDVSLDGSTYVIDGWYQFAGITNTTAPDTEITNDGGKVRIKTTSAAGGPYIALSYGQVLKLEQGKTYVAVMRGTKNAGTKLPELCVNANISNPGNEYQSQLPTHIGDNVYLAVCMFRPRDNKCTTISFGHLTDPGVMDFTFDFVAVAELGDYTKYTSDGLPEVGVFYNGDTIIEEKPTTNGASLYICTTETEGGYGAKDVGCALNGGAWVSAASYTQGDCVSYSSVVYHARTTHTGVATTPDLDTTNWKAIERPDAETQYVPDGNSLFTSV